MEFQVSWLACPSSQATKTRCRSSGSTPGNAPCRCRPRSDQWSTVSAPISSEKLSVLDRTRADVAREVISARPCSRRCHPRSDRYSTVSVPMSSEKQSALDRVRADVAREAIDARPYPRQCRPRGDRCSSVPCRCRPRSNRCSTVSMPMYSIVSTSMSSVRCSVLNRIRTDVVRETISRPCPRRCRPKSDRYFTVSLSMSTEKRSILDHIHVVLDLAAAARAS